MDFNFKPKLRIEIHPMQRNSDKRIQRDRRREPTPAWNWYTFFGLRRKFRRSSDREKGGNVDRASPALFLLLVLILALNIVDSLLTMMILDLGGKEFNPFISSVMALHGDQFWVWKFGIVSFSLILLWLHRGYRLFRKIIISIGSFYLFVVIYQIFLIVRLTGPTIK
jgi:hypothetical protein